MSQPRQPPRPWLWPDGAPKQDPRVHYDDPSHLYTYESTAHGGAVQVLSVSQVLESQGLKGFDRKFWKTSLLEKGLTEAEANWLMFTHTEEACSTGLDAHDLIRAELLGQPLTREPCAESIYLLIQWRKHVLPRIGRLAFVELPMINNLEGFAGTIDLYAEIDGIWSLVDWKRKANEEKAKPEKTWGLQFGGYDRLLSIQQYLPPRPERAINFMIFPEGVKERVYPREELDQLSADFWRYNMARLCDEGDKGNCVSQSVFNYQLSLLPQLPETA